MNKPIIGLTPQYDYENNRVWIGPGYLNAVLAAGGIPILLPLQIDKNDLETIAFTCDGFLFTGGPDISPFRFGEETHIDCGVVVPERDKMEEDLFEIVMQMNKPVLGICRGIQVLNVFLGGSLYQDINSQYQGVNLGHKDITYPYKTPICHSQKSGRSVLTHSVTVEKETLLYDILAKDYIQVNSFHHQAIKDLGNGLKVAGTCADSIIEAVYLPEHPFFLGVQWHPEHLYNSSEDAFAVFKALVDACK